MEARLRKRINNIGERLRENDVMKAREFLATVLDRIEISPTKDAVLYAKVGFVLGTGSVGIPTGI